MSSVRMCDKCGMIFSENSKGWATGTITKRVEDDDGSVDFKTVTQDQCGPCSGTIETPPPRVAIEPGTKPGYDPAYTANLERQAGIAGAEVVG